MICLSAYGTFYVWTGEVEDERGASTIMRDRDDKTYNVKVDVDRYKRFNQTFNSLIRNLQDGMEKKKQDTLMSGKQINPRDMAQFSMTSHHKQKLWHEAFMRLCPQAKQVPQMNWQTQGNKR
jgi:hypothetical protein